ncbi:MAG: glycosyltransferase family 4 protein [Pseudomonadota bacterium]|nr:glycosyltransferase family 4 protein [Pseudomonadota bacterium]
MKILLIHNYYGSTAPSGENQVFEAERDLLRARGHEVETLTRHSDEIRDRGFVGELRGALATAWNPWMARRVSRFVARFRPDVVHVHNSFPLISPAVFHAIGNPAAKVLTLHNYRLFCAAGIPMRDGKVCTLCLDRRSSLPALRHGCYRGSRVATLPLAASVGLHRALGTWRNRVDAFIALSEFQRQRMVDGGLPAAKVFVKPNFYPGDPAPVPWRERDDQVVFAGRLTGEKGVATLVEAWRHWRGREGATPTLNILGDGPLRASLAHAASGLPVQFLGQRTKADTEDCIRRAKLLVLPSEWFEGFPMVIREAFAFGTPVAVSDLGPLPAIVAHGVSGLVFPAANPTALADTLAKAWQNPGELERLGHGARAEFEAKYTAERNYQQLLGIYRAAIAAAAAGQREVTPS